MVAKPRIPNKCIYYQLKTNENINCLITCDVVSCSGQGGEATEQNPKQTKFFSSSHAQKCSRFQTSVSIIFRQTSINTNRQVCQINSNSLIPSQMLFLTRRIFSGRRLKIPISVYHFESSRQTFHSVQTLSI